MKTNVLSVILLFLIINQSFADNPVLCKVSDVTGIWRFHMDTMTIPKSDRDYERFSCGRHQPTVLPEYSHDDPSPQASVLAEIQGNPGGEPQVRTIYVELDGNQDVLTQFSDEAGTEAISSGTWTMVIFEGLTGFFHDATINEDISFNSFWRYNHLSDNEYESDCTQTILGWQHTVLPGNEDEEQWGCFWGEKVSGPYTADNIHFVNEQPDFGNHEGLSFKEQWNELIEEKDNEGRLTWDRQHSASINVNANVARDNPFANSDSNRQQTTDETSSQQNCDGYETLLNPCSLESYDLLGVDPDTINTEDLPESINWNDINGESFFPAIINQDWGDCFLVASIEVLESRMMIMSDKRVQTSLSNSQQKDCNFYIEGCDGGLPINVARYGYEFQLVEKECYERQRESTQTWVNDIPNTDDCQTFQIDDYYLVGGNYGGVSEDLMMKELVAHGPATVVLNAPFFLSQYQGCILEQDWDLEPGTVSYIEDGNIISRMQQTQTETGHTINTRSLRQRGIEFEMVNHSVVLVGYGRETEWVNYENPFTVERRLQNRVLVDQENVDDCPHDGAYWILANSWGENFGEEGFFRIRRGCNDFGIETQSFSMHVGLDEEVLHCKFREGDERC